MTPRQELDRFIKKFSPDTAKKAQAALAKVRKLIPGANLLVYDNYNALAIGFAGGEKASQIALSIAVYPRWVSLFLMHGPQLDDPKGLLKGGGSTVRHIVLEPTRLLDSKHVKALFFQAVARTEPPIPKQGRGKIVIQSVSKAQRPRRAKG
jgi:hypothetical protein